MMRLSLRAVKRVGGWVLIPFLLGLGSCTFSGSTSGESGASPTSAPVSSSGHAVVATNSVICDLVRQIAQETVTLSCLMDAGQDPHTYEPTPSDRRAMEDADLILYDGYNFSPAIIRLVEATQNPAPKVAVLEVAVPQPLMGHAHEHEDHAEADHAEADHAHDTGHSEAGHDAEALVPDPHVWQDAAYGAAMAQVIAENLMAIAPENRDRYQKKAAAIAQQLTELDGWIQTQVNTIPPAKRKLVTTHDSFRYFAEAYGLTVAGALSGLSTDTQISVGTLTELVDLVKASGVPAIFVETTTNPKNIEAVARNANVQVAPQPLFVEGPAGPGTAAETYQAMLVANTCTIVNALGGTCTSAQAPAVPSATP